MSTYERTAQRGDQARKMRHGEVGRVGGGRGGSLTELWAMGMSSARGRFGGCTAQKGSRRRERSERAGRAKMTSRKHIGKARMTNRRCVRGTMADKMMIVARCSDRCAWALIPSAVAVLTLQHHHVLHYMQVCWRMDDRTLLTSQRVLDLGEVRLSVIWLLSTSIYLAFVKIIPAYAL